MFRGGWTRMPRRTHIRMAGLALLWVTSLGVLMGPTASAAPATVAIAGSSGTPATATDLGTHSADASMLVTLVLAPRGGDAMDRFIASLTDPGSPNYHHWLSTGQFNDRYAPSVDVRSAARNFLTGQGLRLAHSPSPFLVRASGSTARVDRAFGTTIRDYRSASGTSFFANAAPAFVPAELSGQVIGVSGLSSTVRHHPSYVLSPSVTAPGKGSSYGGGPGGSGLTPRQLAGIYGALDVHSRPNGQGQGTTLGLLELSGYTPADVRAYEGRFFGRSQDMPLVDVNVDGGPVDPRCPAGDGCGPFGPGRCRNGCSSADYSGDVEVEADMEVQIAMAPKADRMLVYNAPNDILGVTFINTLFRMANEDRADVISSSWGLCEVDDGLGTARAEYMAFAQMAAQGQSFFGSSGDSGAFDCLGDPAHTGVEVDDPASQPYVTSVGGTSLGTFDPHSSAAARYPKGFETVWNPRNACGIGRGGQPSCEEGASGGGVSRFWPRPAYQGGPGVQSSFSQAAPFCRLAARGQACREVPDVSANADQYTPYAEKCTGAATTSGAGASYCAGFVSGTSPRGWFGIGGTSLSSPLWSAVVDLWVGMHAERFGQANRGLYRLFRQAPRRFFHDIDGFRQTETGNGWYPVRPGYDMATGIGSPRVSRIARSH
jgi:subtilase family serine protease